MSLKPDTEEVKVGELPKEILEEYESQPRDLSWRMDVGVRIFAFALSMFQIYTSWAGSFQNLIQRPIHLAFVFTILFATYPLRRRSPKKNQILLIDWILILSTLISCIWVMVNLGRFTDNPSNSAIIDLILGAVMTVIVLEGARRVIGPVLSIMVILGILYALLGNHIPGEWGHRGFSVQMVIENIYTSSLGVWGMITGLSASLIAGFLIFGVLLEKTGGGETFVDLSKRIAGKSHGGPAKVSCFSSAFFGTISGSAAANVVVDGVFNIPLMKKLGYKREFAAAVEATTSAGGQIMPPIMGAGAFIMAEMIGIPYARVAVGAAIPAILFYLGCYSAIHFEAKRLNLKPLTSDMIPSFRKKILPKSLPFFIPVSILVYLLSVGYVPTLSVLYALLISIAWHIASARNMETLRTRLKDIFNALDSGGRAIVTVASLCACAQILVGLFNLTGVLVKFSQLIIALSFGKMILTLFFSMIICLILGMGVPTTAAYVLAASVVAPAITGLGVQPLSTHLFIFYFAIISAITPPVCGAVYIASSIAGANWWKTGWTATRIGLPGFIIPYMFFYAPTLLLYGDPLHIIVNSVTAGLGVIALSAGVMGFYLKPITWIERLLLLLCAVLLIDPGLTTDIIGLVILGGLYIKQRRTILGYENISV